MSTGVTASAQWTRLGVHSREIADHDLRELFAGEPDHGARYAGQVGDLYIDYSKHWLNADTLRLVERMADAVDPPSAI
ncbi:hypothetical protein ACWDO0_02590 [Nocardia rhamnosiphila]